MAVHVWSSDGLEQKQSVMLPRVLVFKVLCED